MDSHALVKESLDRIPVLIVRSTFNSTRLYESAHILLKLVAMLKLLQNSAKVCIEGINSSSQTHMPQLAASALAAMPSRSYSIISLRGWMAQPMAHCAAALNKACYQESPFAVQVSSYMHCLPPSQQCSCIACNLQVVQSRDMAKVAPKFKGGKLKPYS